MANAASSDRADIVLVCHGESESDVEGRTPGAYDSTLTAAGVAQAEAVAFRLHHAGGKKIAACYASTHTERTAQIIKAENGWPFPITFEVGLAEQITVDECEKWHAEECCAQESGEEDYKPPGGGESHRQVQERAVHALEAIARRHPGERVLVVTHRVVLAAALHGILAPAPNRTPKGSLVVSSASLNMLRWHCGQWEVRLWGDSSEFAVGVPEGCWVVDVSAALRLLSTGAVAGALVTASLFGLLSFARRQR